MRTLGLVGIGATALALVLSACANGSTGRDGYGFSGDSVVADASTEAKAPSEDPSGEPGGEPSGDPIDEGSSKDAGNSQPVTDGGGTTPPKDSGSTQPACSTTPPSNKCGVVDQCGCNATQTCDVKDTAGNVECVAAGTAGMGRACTSTAGCEKGLTCVFGTCHAFCSNTCSIPGTNTCYQVQQGTAAVPNFKVCQVTCDLRDANSCGGTNAAGPAACVPDGAGATDCESAGTAAVNQTCSGTASAPSCAPGLTCVKLSNTSNQCKRWCRVGTSDCGSSTCTGFSTKIKVGTVEYGVCP